MEKLNKSTFFIFYFVIIYFFHFIDLINNPVLNIKFGTITWIILVNSDIWIIINTNLYIICKVTNISYYVLKKIFFIDLIFILVNYNNPVLNIKFGMITWIIIVNSDIWIIINARQGHKYVILQMFCGPMLLLLSSLNHKIWIKTADYSKLKRWEK